MLPYKYRWALLLAASCFFYMFFKPIYIFILFFTIIIDYYAGIWIENATGPKKKQYLAYSLMANIGVLAVFKYYNFINGNIDGLATLLDIKNPIPYLTILLPVGLSFHTFQAMSYTIEVYRGNQKAEKHFGIYSLYVMFYPQLVAGPIERPQNILHQFYEKYDINYDRIVSGLRLMLLGFFKKVVIADRMSLVVNQIYLNPTEQNAFTYIVAAYLFTFQIYCDFSGYSDIARGCARIMGFELMLNFNMPYIATSIKEFWSRWHISLSTWFRDYLYIPLGGNRVKSTSRLYANLFIVFLVSGLWHGANWTFIVWGALHGMYLVVAMIREKYVKPATKNIAITIFNWIWTFHLVVLTWIFFRANSIHEALHIIKTIFTNFLTTLDKYSIGQPVFLGLGKYSLSSIFYVLFGGILLITSEYLFTRKEIKALFYKYQWLRFSIYFILLYSIVFLGFFGETQFIYFQF
ncbi:MAG: MBOAT family O-acyltransferase [Bacteroidota bacterium]